MQSNLGRIPEHRLPYLALTRTFSCRLGCGAFGFVRRAIGKHNGETYAVKVRSCSLLCHPIPSRTLSPLPLNVRSAAYTRPFISSTNDGLSLTLAATDDPPTPFQPCASEHVQARGGHSSESGSSGNSTVRHFFLLAFPHRAFSRKASLPIPASLSASPDARARRLASLRTRAVY